MQVLFGDHILVNLLVILKSDAGNKNRQRKGQRNRSSTNKKVEVRRADEDESNSKVQK